MKSGESLKMSDGNEDIMDVVDVDGLAQQILERLKKLKPKNQEQREAKFEAQEYLKLYITHQINNLREAYK